MKDKVEEVKEVNESLFDKDVDLVRELVRMGWQMSPDFTFLTSNVLNYRLTEQIKEFEQDKDFSHFEAIKNVKQTADELGLKLDTSYAARVVEKVVLGRMRVLDREFDVRIVKMLRHLNRHMSSLDIRYRRYEVQNKLWEIMRKKIVPEFDRIFKDGKMSDFFQEFILLAEDFNFNVDFLRDKFQKMAHREVQDG